MDPTTISYSLPQPASTGPVHIHVFHARAIGDGRWEGRATITWPDGSHDVGANGLLGGTKTDAEKLAEKKACERWAAIDQGTLQKTHPDPVPKP